MQMSLRSQCVVLISIFSVSINIVLVYFNLVSVHDFRFDYRDKTILRDPCIVSTPNFEKSKAANTQTQWQFPYPSYEFYADLKEAQIRTLLKHRASLLNQLPKEREEYMKLFHGSNPDANAITCGHFLYLGLDTQMWAGNRQDWFLYHNFFSGKTNGYYLDIGTNKPIWGSNSYFFEKCLNWTGLCVEPNPEYHASIREERPKCKLVPNCIYKNRMKVKFSVGGGAVGKIESASVQSNNDNNTSKLIEVECITVSELLAMIPGYINKLDFISLDVEGFETDVLDAFPQLKFDPQDPTTDLIKASPKVDANILRSRVNFFYPSIWTIETNQYFGRGLDKRLNDMGYVKTSDIGPDSVYEQRSKPLIYPNNFKKVYEEDHLYEPYFTKLFFEKQNH